MESDFEIFKGKSYSSLCEDIYNNSSNKKDQIDILIAELRQLIKSVNDAMIIVPLIREYLDVSVRNDEHLVKLAAVLQRYTSVKMVNGAPVGGPMLLTEQEKQQLLQEVETVMIDVKDDKKEIVSLEKKVEEVKEKIENKKQEINSELENI